MKVQPRKGVASRLEASVARDSDGDVGREAYTAAVWGVGLSHEMGMPQRRRLSPMVERNMNGAAMRGIVALPGSKATSRTEGSRRNLGGPASGRHLITSAVRIGKVMSRSR